MKQWRKLLLWLAVLGPSGAAADDLAERVVILANASEPESVRLAEFYAEKRGIPPANIIALEMPVAESITWREFIDQIYQPLQDELVRRGWISGTGSKLLDRFGRKRYSITGHRISYFVTCRGVPLRIYNDPTLLDEAMIKNMPTQFRTNEGAVDSELCLLAQAGYDITAAVRNPLFKSTETADITAELLVKVSRLDGPTWGDARRLVNSALEGERNGLLGRAYVDRQGPHAKGDRWLDDTRQLIEKLGFDVTVENGGNTFSADARFDAPVLYFGWYAADVNGPFTREGFQFPPGAIALHIHSFSATTMHSPTKTWAGPLVSRGVAATLGNVFEPYLEYTIRPDLFFAELSAGSTFGDAVYFASPMLSWQAIAIGDPLYRPFKVSLDEQLKSLDRLPPTLGAYAVIRQANLLRREQRGAEALAAIRVAMRKAPHLALALDLAHTALAAHDPKAAVSAVEFAKFSPQIRPEDWVLIREIADILAANNARPSALQIYTVLARSTAPSPGALKEMLMAARTCADAAGDLARSVEFGRLLNPPTATVNPPAGPTKPKR